MFELIELSKSYGASRVLQGASLTVDAGEAVCLVGANAVGKTTLLTIAAGLQKPDGGKICYPGSLGFVPQETALLEDLTVRENLALWRAAQSGPQRPFFSPDAPETALGLLPFAGQRVSRLSGGMKKRAAVACALWRQPDWLLMDEPFTALDLQSRTEITNLLRAIKRRGGGILFSSHDPVAIAGLADRILLLQNGGVVPGAILRGDERQRLTLVFETFSRA